MSSDSHLIIRRSLDSIQCRMWSFQGKCTKLEKFLAKNQLSQMKSLNFANWCNGEVQKRAEI